MAHRLALAVIQAAKVVTPVDRFKNYINSLFVYFHGSAKRQGILKATFEALLNKPGLKLHKPSDTRWLACDEAVQVVKKNLEPLSVALQELALDDATALGLYTLLSEYEFVAGVFFMSEILPILSRLLKTFQIENLDFSSIKPALKRAKDSIVTLRNVSESNVAGWQKQLSNFQLTTTLSGHSNSSFMLTFVLPFIQAVLDNLLARFPDEDIKVLSAGEVFLPSKIPANSTYCYSYGRDHVSTLARHYGCDVEETIYEWKEVVVTLKQKTNAREVLYHLLTAGALYPNLAKISASLLVIPVHSADCERGFSALGRIKNKLRSRLTNKSLNSLLMISLNGPPLKDFNFQFALQKWAGIRN